MKSGNVNSILIVVSIFILQLLIGCSSEPETIDVKGPTPVETVQVVKSTIRNVVHTSGILQSGQSSKLSFKIGGIIKDIAVSDGQNVRQGQVLAALYQDEIKARVTSAKTQFDKAKRDYERANNLYQDNAISLQQKQNAKSGLDAAEASLQIAEFNAKRASITAPTNGKILQVIAEENEMIDAGHPVVLFASTERNWVIKVHVSDKDVVSLALGDTASVSFDVFPGSEYNATVQEITESADPYTGLYAVELVLLQTPRRLVNGLVAIVDIVPGMKFDCYLLPVECLYQARGKEGSVMAINGSGIVREIPVQILEFHQDKLAVVGDFQNVDRVVMTGVSYLRDGDKVNITDREVK